MAISHPLAAERNSSFSGAASVAAAVSERRPEAATIHSQHCVSSRIFTFEPGEETLGKWSIEIVGDEHTTVVQAQHSCSWGLADGHQSRDGLAGSGDDDLLAPGDPCEQTGEVGLRLVNVDRLPTASLHKV